NTSCGEQRKPLVPCEAYLLAADRETLRRQTKILMEPACVMQRIGEAERMVDRAREFKHFVIHLKRRLGIAEVPQRQREIAAMRHSGMFTDSDRPHAGPLPIVVIARQSRLVLLPRA